MISETFINRLHEYFGADVANKVEEGLTKPASVSIRKNSTKPRPLELDGSPVPWSENGVVLEKRPAFSLDPHFHAGAYYVQDSSSMFLEAILNRIDIDQEDGIFALDACAAPGGKSILLADYLNDKGFLIANEIDSIVRDVMCITVTSINTNLVWPFMGGITPISSIIKFIGYL